jgi:hypothetical protein
MKSRLTTESIIKLLHEVAGNLSEDMMDNNPLENRRKNWTKLSKLDAKLEEEIQKILTTGKGQLDAHTAFNGNPADFNKVVNAVADAYKDGSETEKNNIENYIRWAFYPEINGKPTSFAIIISKEVGLMSPSDNSRTVNSMFYDAFKSDFEEDNIKTRNTKNVEDFIGEKTNIIRRALKEFNPHGSATFMTFFKNGLRRKLKNNLDKINHRKRTLSLDKSMGDDEGGLNVKLSDVIDSNPYNSIEKANEMARFVNDYIKKFLLLIRDGKGIPATQGFFTKYDIKAGKVGEDWYDLYVKFQEENKSAKEVAAEINPDYENYTDDLKSKYEAAITAKKPTISKFVNQKIIDTGLLPSMFYKEFGVPYPKDKNDEWIEWNMFAKNTQKVEDIRSAKVQKDDDDFDNGGDDNESYITPIDDDFLNEVRKIVRKVIVNKHIRK